jgi:hypothetical protein
LTPHTTDFVPLIVPALVLALRRTAAIGWRWWALTGLCFGVTTALIWNGPFRLGGALVAAPLVAAGAAIGGRIWHVVERPTLRRVLTFVALADIAAPAFTGVGVALRARTPEARFADVPPRRRREGAGRNARGLFPSSLDRVLVHGTTLVGQ